MKYITALIISMMLAPQVFAFGGGFSLERGLFRNADHNRSETIDIEEAKRLGNYDLSNPEVFARFDTSGEGYIDFTEFRDYVRLSTPKSSLDQ